MARGAAQWTYRHNPRATGRARNGRRPLGVSVDCFGPIGSESAPIIEFFDAMGRHRLVERAIEYFFNEQREDGQIMGFARYESETGPVLALVGNHLRYSGNSACSPLLPEAGCAGISLYFRNCSGSRPKAGGHLSVIGGCPSPARWARITRC